MSPCPIAGCSEQMRDGNLLCVHHWARVPHKLQLQVLKSWNAYNRARTPAGRRIALAAYKPARNAAIAAVTRKVPA